MFVRFMCFFHQHHARIVCVLCVCGLFVTLWFKCNFDADARVRISKNTLKKPLTKPSFEVHDKWQLEVFSPAGKD
jgi:hypothetical protein